MQISPQDSSHPTEMTARSPFAWLVGGLIVAIAVCGVAAALVGEFHPAFLVAMGAISAALVALVWIDRVRLKRANLQLVNLNRKDQMLLDIMLDNDADSPGNWSFELDKKARLKAVSPGFASATGVTAEISGGLDFIAFLENLGAQPKAQIAGLKNRIETGSSFRNVDLQLATEGQTIHWCLSGAPLADGNGDFIGFAGVCFDVSAAHRTEVEIAKMAHFDTLTGLINRAQFSFQLEHLVSRLERYGSAFSVMSLDLDNFKAVNDAHGYSTGDVILSAVAQRIKDCIRDTDMAARVGGDSFAILLPNSGNRREIEVVAERITKAMQQAFDVDGEAVHVGISSGIALAPLNGTSAEQLLRNVDLALYGAKTAGRNVYRFFEAEMDAEDREKRMLETELRAALHNGEIELYFQPLVDCQSGKTTAFEALVRWNHPIRGIVSPVEFIPIAEETGSILDIGNWTIQEACRVAKTWPEDVKVAVNLSPRHFSETDIVQVTKDALKSHNLPSDRLELEITEAVLMGTGVDAPARLTELQRLGVTIAMDDFGTGYSNLSFLMELSVDKIKIDKSFIDKIPSDLTAQRNLKAITALGASLDISITAEGVESKAQAEFLSDIACQSLQGYYFAKPLREIDLAAYLLKTNVKAEKPTMIEEEFALTG